LTSRYDDAVDVTDPVIDLLADLRPQPYAMVRTDRIANPIVEPQWGGVRALAAVEDGSVALRDEAGQPFTERPEVERALGGAVHARSAILDGYLTKQPAGEIVYTTPPPDVPSITAFVAKPFIGIRRDRAQEKKAYDARLAEEATFLDDDRVAFVAIDLLRLDGDSLLDVPLLERKRLLDSVVTPSDLVRVGAYVRPPLQTWIATWRRLGFVGLSYRAANSRYHPGEEHEDWTLVPMPRR
jgi:bifunctional non-homologous end joining protein LigD